jgi:type VI secretion system ImpM family protein
VTPISTGRSGLIGKVKGRAEYLPVPSSAPSFAAFDAWLSTSIDWATARADAGWSECFARGAVHGFVFRAPGSPPGELLCGSLAPSRDQSGRQFPLALATALSVPPELLARPELLPFVLERVWGDATRALLDVLTTGDPELATNFKAELTTDVTEAAALYDHWASQLPLVELWALLGPGFNEPEPALRLLLETLNPVRGNECPKTKLSLRLPLGLASGLGLCFWLDVVRRSLHWQRTIPSLFWSHDGNSGAVILPLGEAPAATLAELWLPTGRRDDIADLTLPASPLLVDALPPLAAPVRAALSARGAPVAAFLESASG